MRAQSLFPAKARLGRMLKGKWKLEEVLGEGGMSVVYRARHRNGSEVAIKMLHPQVSGSSTLRRSFTREGYLLNLIQHSGVARVLDDDVDEVDGSVFLVMDLLPGISLAERASQRLLDEPEALEVAEQVLEILAAAHAKSVVHRDIKPENILVDELGTVRLVDFGIAHDAASRVDTLTGSARSYGTPGYVSPEQALGRNEAISARTDLFAVGATLFHVMSGAHLHEGKTPQELVVAAATREARSLAIVAPHVSREVVALVDRATRMRVEQRWPSALAMLAEVQRIQLQRGLPRASVPPMPSRRISSRLNTAPEIPIRDSNAPQIAARRSADESGPRRAFSMTSDTEDYVFAEAPPESSRG